MLKWDLPKNTQKVDIYSSDPVAMKIKNPIEIVKEPRLMIKVRLIFSEQESEGETVFGLFFLVNGGPFLKLNIKAKYVKEQGLVSIEEEEAKEAT